jgi:SHS2 domain-containing protein
MPYEYLDGIAVADVAFRASGKTLEEVFEAAVDATTGAMVENLSDVGAAVRKRVRLSDSSLDLLLYQLLQEIVFYKDAERLLLRAGSLSFGEKGGAHVLDALLVGERIDEEKHRLIVDVKAVTLHRLSLRETGAGWEATVVLDV